MNSIFFFLLNRLSSNSLLLGEMRFCFKNMNKLWIMLWNCISDSQLRRNGDFLTHWMTSKTFNQIGLQFHELISFFFFLLRQRHWVIIYHSIVILDKVKFFYYINRSSKTVKNVVDRLNWRKRYKKETYFSNSLLGIQGSIRWQTDGSQWIHFRKIEKKKTTNSMIFSLQTNRLPRQTLHQH